MYRMNKKLMPHSISDKRIVAEKFSDYLLIHFLATCGQIIHQMIKLIFVSINRDIVHVEKNNGSNSTNPFITINKGMIFNDIKKIGSRHLKQVFVEKYFLGSPIFLKFSDFLCFGEYLSLRFLTRKKFGVIYLKDTLFVLAEILRNY